VTISQVDGGGPGEAPQDGCRESEGGGTAAGRDGDDAGLDCGTVANGLPSHAGQLPEGAAHLPIAGTDTYTRLINVEHKMNALEILPCSDSAEQAEECRRQLDIERRRAQELGRSAVDVSNRGNYLTQDGRTVDLRDLVQAARSAKQSIPPEAPLPVLNAEPVSTTQVQVANATTLAASQQMVGCDLKPLALNFANGIHPGGGFLNGARAQEEVLCRSSALYLTLLGDPMYEHHKLRPQPDSTDWVILSPKVPVFREDGGAALDQPWLLDIITCAAPYAHVIGQSASAVLLRRRIQRVLSVARAFGYQSLVLGAWGCGAFGNDTVRCAADFREALENEFRGVFSKVVFAITDWSPERKFLGPFRDAFIN